MSAQSMYPGLSQEAREALDEVLGRDDQSIVGIILTGSAARGLASALSDVDVIVVRDEPECTLDVERGHAIDEIPMTLRELETVLPVGSDGAWVRWQFAWAKVLRDRTDGRVSAAVRRQGTLEQAEQNHVLVRLSRLDAFINFAYRALKSHRDGRALEARLDSAESIAPLLDVVFALEGRVRPYNKYLMWELTEHPLSNEDWHVGPFTCLIEGLLGGSEAAIRDTFTAIERACRTYDEVAGTSSLQGIIEGWGADLVLLRG